MSDLTLFGETDISPEKECYQGLDHDAVIALEENAQKAHTIANRTSFELGEILCRAQSIYHKKKHNGFESWVTTRFRLFGVRTAYSLIGRHKNLVLQNFAEQDSDQSVLDSIVLSGQYQLAAPSTPQSARDEALELAQKRNEEGKTVSLKEVDEIIAAHKIAKEKAELEFSTLQQSFFREKSAHESTLEVLDRQIKNLHLQIRALEQKEPETVPSPEQQAEIARLKEEVQKEKENYQHIMEANTDLRNSLNSRAQEQETA